MCLMNLCLSHGAAYDNMLPRFFDSLINFLVFGAIALIFGPLTQYDMSLDLIPTDIDFKSVTGLLYFQLKSGLCV